MKFLFTPVSILAGLLAGLVGKKIFERLWRLIDKGEPPSPEHRELLAVPRALESKQIPAPSSE